MSNTGAFRKPSGRRKPPHIEIPSGVKSAEIEVQGEAVTLTNLTKLFWP